MNSNPAGMCEMFKGLTTPVSYISSSAFVDVFKPLKENEQSNFISANHIPQICYLTSVVSRKAKRRRGEPFVFSRGPDRIVSDHGFLFHRNDSSNFFAYAFDPSNGLNSYGDIYYSHIHITPITVELRKALFGV